jgi:hypothetical protein
MFDHLWPCKNQQITKVWTVLEKTPRIGFYQKVNLNASLFNLKNGDIHIHI